MTLKELYNKLESENTYFSKSYLKTLAVIASDYSGVKFEFYANQESATYIKLDTVFIKEGFKYTMCNLFSEKYFNGDSNRYIEDLVMMCYRATGHTDFNTYSLIEHINEL